MSERQNSLTGKVKKGLSNVLNRSSKNSSSTSAEVNAKKFKLAAASTTTSKPERKKKTTKKSLDLAGSQSLPSSQNEKIVIREDPAEESEYESAEE